MASAMILEIRPLSAGNALQLTLRPAAGALLTRVLRKATNDIVDQNDPDAEVVYEGTDTSVVDISPALANEVPVFYQAFDFFGAFTWASSPSMTGTPTATYEDASTDVQSMLRERLEKGIAVEVTRGTLKPGQPHGAIAVLTSPPTAEETDWPVFTVQLDYERPGERGIGELVTPDFFDALADEWVEAEGWLADVSCTCTGWCTNPDQRIELRKALRRVLVANLGVFASQGVIEISLQASDDQFLNGEFGPANVFTTAVTFTCKAPVIVRENVIKVVDVQTTQIDIPVFN
jgi:hypothetical protein